MNLKKANQRGFTMIEVVMIIVIFGIIAAVAIPRFFNPVGDAQKETLKNIASSLESASAKNYSSCTDKDNMDKENKCIKVTKCSDITVIMTPRLTLGPAGVAIENSYNLVADNAVEANGSESTCTLQYLLRGETYTATYIITGTGQL